MFIVHDDSGNGDPMHSLVVGSTLAVIEGAAHMPNLELPAERNAALRRPLDTVVA